MNVFVTVLFSLLIFLAIIYYIVGIIFNFVGRPVKCPKCNNTYNRREWSIPKKMFGFSFKLKHKKEIAKVVNNLYFKDNEFKELLNKEIQQEFNKSEN